jgi:hypothetical protein
MPDQFSSAFANGATYRINEANTTFIDAGAVTFGIEHATVDAQTLRSRGGPERDYIEGGIIAAGVDLCTVDIRAIFFHVLGRDRTQYIRLDYVVNADEIDFSEFRWHWHFTPPATDEGAEVGRYDVPNIKTYHYDQAANGPDIWRWWFDCLATRLPDMLRQAGGGDIADQIDPDIVASALARARSVVDQRRVADARDLEKPV